MELELSFGKNLTSQEEKLTPLTLADLYSMIRQPESALARQQSILRSILNIDAGKYRNLKKNLPYFVCGKFACGRRVADEFASTSSFVIDLDHFDSPDKTLQELKDELSQDERIALLFTSPSGTGLKMLFLLDQPCTDANVYAAFYRQFALEFAKEHDITRFVDYRTNDVARACFIASDPDCRINLTAQPVAMDQHVNLQNVDLFLSEDKQLTATCHELAVLQTDERNAQEKGTEPDKDTLQRIKAVLDTNRRKRAEKEEKEREASMAYVPFEIRNIMDGLKTSVEETGIELYETKGIQYGVKLMFRTAVQQAEINVFYGKKGYSVVLSPKRGTSPQLGGMMRELVSDYIYGITV